MIDANMITVEHNALSLTDAGRALARKIDALQKANAKARADAAATHHPHDFESYRAECKARFAAVHEGEAPYKADPPPNPIISGKTFYRTDRPNNYGITHVCPANSGMAYGLTKDKKIALLLNPTNTDEITGIIGTPFAAFNDAQIEFFRRQYNVRNGGKATD